jgi:hypothetical protein
LTTSPYGRISLFFISILLVLTWGFYKTYLIFFPSFAGFTFIHHFHGVIMLIWMLMLIVQPLLIRSGRLSLHRLIGKFSFLIAPLVVISIFFAAKTSFLRSEPPLPVYEKIAGIALPIPSMLAFAVLYCLAILNRRHTYQHMRYMIGTALMMIGPGLGRALIVYFNIPFPQSVNIIWYVTMGIAAALLLNDLLRKQSFTANGVILAVVGACYITWQLRYTQAWQATGELIATHFFRP